MKRKKTTIDKIKVAFNNCYTENCFGSAVERCNSCKELFCEEHVNDHDFCERVKKLRDSRSNKLTETQVSNFYKKIHAQIGAHHNTILTKRKKHRCKECQNDTIVIFQPTDTKTRTGDYRFICILCQLTWVVESNEILHEQNLFEFVKETIVKFKLT